MNAAVAGRVRQLAGEQEHRHACAEFAERRTADRQARADALLADVIDVLARALDASRPPSRPCRACHRQLASRVRRCPSCRYVNAAVTA